MKLLLDSCLSGKVRDILATAGHDAAWTGDWDEDPGDQTILETAHSQARILITLDKDFGELAIVRQLPHSGILRLVNLAIKQQAPICLQVLERYGEELLAGAIVTATFDRIRIRPPD